MAVSVSRERWRQVQRLFAEVVGLDPARREARLERACRDDPRLRGDVQVLLDRHERGEALGPKYDPVRPPQPPERFPAVTPMASPEDLFAGRYRLIEELGRGAMGVVYKAEDTKLDCFVALKFLHPRLAADSKARERLLLEARAASELHHPNICRIIDHDEAEDGRVYLVMAYYDGGESLEEILKRGPLPVERAIDIARQISSGLHAAHRPTPRHPAGIVHRDIKPSNVLITPGDVAIILDFGIAKVAESGVTREGDVLGTVEYMSPEHLRERRVDAGTDLWALGVTLYEMLTGSRPFRGDYEAALFYTIVHEEPAPVQSLRPDVPGAVAEVVRRCMEKDPEARYRTAGEIIEALESTHEEKRGAPAIVRPSRRRALLIAAFAVLGLLLPSTMPGVRTAMLGWVGIANVPAEKRIAVLPFSVAGTDPSAEAFSDGLVEILASTLTQIERFDGKLWVVPTSEVRGRAVESAEEARKAFGVNLVVTGSVQRDAGHVRSTLNLIDATTLRQLRSKVNEVPLSRLDELQDRLVGDLEAMLGLELGEEPRLVLTAGGTPVPGAYDYYVQGLGYLRRYESVENLDHAIRLFERALAEDPGYALAHAGLGEAYWRQFEATQDERWVAHAVEHSEHALALDPQLAPVHVTLGLIHTGMGRTEDALAEFERALEIAPSNATAVGGLAKAYALAGDVEEAEATYRRAIALRPDYWGGYNDLGRFYAGQGRFEEALEPFRRITELTPDNHRGYSNLGAVYSYLGRGEEAEAMFEHSIQAQPTREAYSNLATLYYYRGRFEDAARMYEAALAISDQDPLVWGNLGAAYYWSGTERDRAEAAYRTAIRRIEERRTALGTIEPDVLAELAGYHAQLGEGAEARSHIEQAVSEAPEQAIVAFRAAFVYEQLGERDQALTWVHRAIELGHPQSEIDNEPGLRDLRADPRFAEGHSG